MASVQKRGSPVLRPDMAPLISSPGELGWRCFSSRGYRRESYNIEVDRAGECVSADAVRGSGAKESEVSMRIYAVLTCAHIKYGSLGAAHGAAPPRYETIMLTVEVQMASQGAFRGAAGSLSLRRPGRWGAMAPKYVSLSIVPSDMVGVQF